LALATFLVTDAAAKAVEDGQAIETAQQHSWLRWLVRAAWFVVPVGLFFCYLRVSQTEGGDSYGAVFSLQGWDMLHGNPILRGWALSDVSFYTTELPEYMLVVAARGLNPSVVHICAAITYTLLLVLAALLAKGRAQGKDAVVRVLITVGILCSPQLGNGLFVLLGAPDHLGTCVPVLLAWLILDRAPARWWVPAAVAVLLAWTLVADPVVLLTAVVPLVAVCGIRLLQAVVADRQRLRSRWLELSLIAAAGIAYVLAREVLAMIRAHGGFVVNPVSSVLTPLHAMGSHLQLTGQAILLLFGADFFGSASSEPRALLILHLVGVALVLWAVCVAIFRFFRRTDLVSQILVVAILANLAAFIVWAKGSSVSWSREMVAVLPYGAALAGRLLAGKLLTARLLTRRLLGSHLTGAWVLLSALSLVLCGYLASLGYVASRLPAQPLDQQLTSWLVAHHRHAGIAPFALDIAGTISSGQRVDLLAVAVKHSAIIPSHWETKLSWYDPRRNNANYAVVTPSGMPSAAKLSKAYGPPARTYHVGRYAILTWNKNLLAELGETGFPPNTQPREARERPGDRAAPSRRDGRRGGRLPGRARARGALGLGRPRARDGSARETGGPD
jgi:hypothetical protein